MRDFSGSVAAIVVIAVAGAVAAKPRIESHWRDHEIAIDGDNGDWAGPLAAVDDTHPVTAAAANDGRFLFLVLSTSDAVMRRQIMRQGLIVWFDPGGGTRKHFGIRFPVGLALTMAGRGGRGRPGPDQPDQPDRIDPPNRLEVYGPSKGDAHTFVLEQAPGISVKVGQVEGYLVYELKVPLARTSETPYAIEAKPGSIVGLGLETPKIEHSQRMGGFGGIGGGMGGRGAMGRRRSDFEAPTPLKAWATVQLSAR
jgi:hypothetical protein